MNLLDLNKRQSQYENEKNMKAVSKVLIPRTGQTYKFIIPSPEFVVEVPSHYIFLGGRGVYVKCLGDECPVCKRNEEIREKHKEDYRNISDFRPRNKRIGILVYDITEYKYCTNCGTENVISNKVCYRCGIDKFSDPEPANAYKTLPLSYNQATLLSKSLEDFVLEIGAEFGEFYTKLIVDKTEGNRRNLVFTHYPLKEKIELPEIDFSADILSKYTVFELSEKELVELLSGATLKEILAVRSKPEEVVENKSEEVNEEVENAVKELFSE